MPFQLKQITLQVLVEKSSMGTPTLEYDRVKISGVPKLDFSTSRYRVLAASSEEVVNVSPMLALELHTN
jgi:hypothetical protein